VVVRLDHSYGEESNSATAVGSPASASISHTKIFTQQGGNSSGLTFTFTASANAANEAVVMGVNCVSNTAATAVSLTASGWTFTRLGSIGFSGSSSGAVFGAISPNTTSATFTVTWTGAGSCTFHREMGDEFAGTDTTGGTTTFDCGTTCSGGSNNAHSTNGSCSVNVTTGSANEAVWGVCWPSSSVTALGTGYSAGANDAQGDRAEYKLTTDAAGTLETVNFTSTTTYNAVAVTIKPAAGGTSPSITSLSPATGPIGTAVTISGSNFGGTQGTSTVSFGGLNITPTSWTSTTIGVTVPAGLPLGPASVIVTVTGAGTSNSATFTVVAPLAITASAAPAANAAGWNNSNVTVSYQCTGGVAPVQCPGSQTVTTEGASQVISATATDAIGEGATASVTLKIDKTAPALSITSPANNSTVTNSSLLVSGTVSDSLSGVSGVTCNGSAATVQSGTFSCTVALTNGSNTIAVQATDVAGNSSTQSVTVTFGVPSITDFNPKSGPAGTLVTITGTNLVIGTGGTATVTLNQQGSGTISAPITTASPTSISFVIPPGAATGAITVTTANLSATSSAVLNVTARSSFSMSVGPATANVIQGQSAAYAISLNSTDGFSQLAALSVAGLPTGVTANFSPTQITNGQISILTVNAPAGQTVGTSTLTISAAATVDGIASTQTSTVSLAVQPVTTSFFGRILESDTIETPIPGIRIVFLGKDDANNPTGCNGSTSSDAAGNFLFTNLPAACVGRQLVWYNGQTSTDGELYAGVNLAYTIIQGQPTGPEQVHLPLIDNAETVQVHQNWPTDQVFNFTTIPGITVTVYANTTFTLPNGTTPDPFPFTGVQVPVDRLPDAPVDGTGTLRAFIVAFQPDNTVASQPVSVVWPNSTNTPPGVNMELDTLDSVVGNLIKYGTGTVSGDGTTVIPDLDPAHPGHRYGIEHFDWHGPLAPAKNEIDPSTDPNGPRPGDPVDAATGLLIVSKTDLAFGGARGHVAINRTYRTLSNTPGPFGVGTNFNYGYQLNTFSFTQGQGFVMLIMPDGNQLQFTQQAGGTLVNTSVPSLAGAVITIPSGGVYNLRWKDGTVFKFQSPPTGTRVAFLNSITDTNNNVTTMVRGNSADPSQITQITDPVGRSLTLTYDTFDRITSIVDPIGRTVSYTYNSQGTLATVTDAAGGVTQYAYDSNNRMTDITDPRGILYLHNDYASGKVVKQTAADGGVTTFSYTVLNANSNITFSQNTGGGGGGGGVLTLGGSTINTSPVLLATVTDPLGNQTTYHFNPQGYLIDVTDALGRKTIYERDPGTNQVLRVTDPLNRVTTFTYDAVGNPTSITRLAGTPGAVTVFTTYDPVFNKPTSFTDALGHTTSLTYDAAGNLFTLANPLSHKTTFTYDPTGELLTTTDALGNKVQFAYSNGNISSTTDPLGNVTTQTSDAVGRLLSATTPLGQTSQYSYDPLNHATRMTDAAGGTTAYVYDANGNLLSLHDALGHTTSYTYDSMDRVITRTDPLNRLEQYGYDLNGNLLSRTDRKNQVTSMIYDSLNRLKLVGFNTVTSGGIHSYESTVSYTYDSGNRMTEILDSSGGTIMHDYDNLDRLISENSAQGLVTYAYDAAGRNTAIQVAGQPSISYSYDNANRLTQIAQAVLTVTVNYDDANRRSTLASSNGVNTSYTYDNDSRVTGITYKFNASTLGNLSYVYDLLGRRTQVGGSFARTGLPGTVTSATYDAANQLTNWNGTPIGYDLNGNMLSDGANAFSWNARNQVATLNSIPLQYDALGRRTKNLQNTSFLFDGPSAVQELSGSTATANLISGGIDEVFTHSDSTGAFTSLQDALGSTIALVDTGGNVVTQYSYDPFGNTTVSGATNSNLFQYTGRENERNGLYFYRARYYAPLLGRFISQDPKRFSAGVNFYSYTDDDPINFNDSSGMDGHSCPDVPTAPGYANLQANIAEAEDMHKLNYIPGIGQAILYPWFKHQVNYGARWDYKQNKETTDFFNTFPGRPGLAINPASPFEDFGNFNYGATGAAAGIPLDLLLRAAGYYGTKAQPGNSAWDAFNAAIGGAPYGDDPADQPHIIDGFNYYKRGCHERGAF
jgi:RHS repeat-associated protein